jgi:YtxH-like protein
MTSAPVTALAAQQAQTSIVHGPLVLENAAAILAAICATSKQLRFRGNILLEGAAASRNTEAKECAMTDYEPTGENESSKRGILGTAFTFLFIGLGIGAVVGLLFAPKTGRQMRHTIARKSRRAVDGFTDQAGALIERGNELANAARRIIPLRK